MAKNDNCSSGAYKERKSSLRHVILPNTERGHRLNIVKSPFTGRYVLAKEFSPVEKEFAEKSASLQRDDSFFDLYNAYRQFDEDGTMDNELRLAMLWETVWLFHQNFTFKGNYSVEEFKKSYPFFVEAILKLVNNYNIPPLVKADLCRHAGLFSRCRDFVADVPLDSDERELFEYVCMLAAHGNRYPIRFSNVWDFITVRNVRTSPSVYWFYEEFLY